MSYKMIALDLDGTLTNSDKKISKKTREALIEIQKQGKKVVLATGRPIQGAIPISEILELEKYGGFILSFNGAIIKDCKKNEIIYQAKIPVEFIEKLGKASRDFQLPIITYKDDYMMTEDTTDTYVRLESWINKLPIHELHDFVKEVDFPVTKCLMVGDGWYVESIMPEMKKRFGEDLNIFRSEPFFMEIMPKGVDKAFGLERLLEYTGIKREELIACGDGFNDLSMIKYAGLGVAMENAQEDVKAVADVVTLSNDDDGIVAIVEKYMKN